MKEYWLTLNARQQRLLIAMVSVIAFFILYSAIWKPLTTKVASATSKIERYEKLNTWVATETQRYKIIAGSGNSSNSTGSLSSIVNKTANKNQISIARMQPQGDEIQIWIDEVSFNQLLTWLEQLSRKENITVKAIDLAHAEQAGVVKVRRLQLGRN